MPGRGDGRRVMSIVPGTTACLRCLSPPHRPAAQLPTCDTAGVLARRVAIASIAAAAGNAAINRRGPMPRGLISSILWSGQWRELASALAARARLPLLRAAGIPFLCKIDGDLIQPCAAGRRGRSLSAGRTCVDLGSAARHGRGSGRPAVALVRPLPLARAVGIDPDALWDGRLLPWNGRSGAATIDICKIRR